MAILKGPTPAPGDQPPDAISGIAPSRFRISIWEVGLLVLLTYLLLVFYQDLQRYSESDGKEILWDVKFSRDGKMVARASELGLAIYDAESGKRLHQFDETEISRVAFSADSRILVTGGRRGEITIRDTGTGKVIDQLTDSSAEIMDLAISPDTTTIYTLERAAIGGRIRSRKLAGGDFQHDFTMQTEVDAFALSPDAKWMVTVGTPADSQKVEVKLWDTERNMIVHRLPELETEKVKYRTCTPSNPRAASGFNFFLVKAISYQ